MNKFLFLSKNGESLSLARRIVDEGNRVHFAFDESSSVGDGLIEKVEGDLTIERLLKLDPEYVVFDFVERGCFELAEKLQKSGIATFGASSFYEALLNQTYVDKLFKACGLTTKDSSIMSSQSTDSIDLTIVLWMNGAEVAGSLLIFEDLKLLDRNRGPFAQMGSLGRPMALSDFSSSSFTKLVEALIAANFYGPVSVRLVAGANLLIGAEIKPGLDFNSIFGSVEGLKGGLASLFACSAIGNLHKLRLKDEWFAQASVPLFRATEGISFKITYEGAIRHIWFKDISLNGSFKTCGRSNELFIVSARGETIREARRRVYRTINRVAPPDSIYRSDIGARVFSDFQKLVHWHLAKEAPL